MTIGAPIYYPASPIAIRDGTLTRVKTISAFGGRVFPARATPSKDDDLPYASVWHAGERTQPMGDANTGAPEFDHTLTLVVDVAARANIETDLNSSILELVETIRATLLTDPTWVMLFEGCERCDTRYSFPKEGTLFYAAASIEFELMFRSAWPPYVPNDLREVAVRHAGLKDQPTILDVTFEGSP